MSKVFVKLVKSCKECPNSRLYDDGEDKLLFCVANKNQVIDVEWYKIPDWCPLEEGEAIEIIHKCKICRYAVYNDNNIDIWCSLNHKYIPKKRDYSIPNWCLLKIKGGEK